MFRFLRFFIATSVSTSGCMTVAPSYWWILVQCLDSNYLISHTSQTSAIFVLRLKNVLQKSYKNQDRWWLSASRNCQDDAEWDTEHWINLTGRRGRRSSFRRSAESSERWAGEIVRPRNNVFFPLQVLLGLKANNADILLKYEQSLCLASQVQRSVGGFELPGQRLHRAGGTVSLGCPARRLSFWLSSVSLKSWPQV